MSKLPRRRILCKVNSGGDTMIFYRDGTWRWKSIPTEDEYDINLWKIAYSDIGNMILFSNGYDCPFEVNWQQDNEEDVKIGKIVGEAIASLALEEMLKGK